MNSNEHGSHEPYQHNENTFSYHRVNTFDPNLGTVASRYSPPYCQEAALNDCGNSNYGNVILIPTNGNLIGHENGLLSVAEAAQTIESGILDQYNILPDRIITTYIHSTNESEQNFENIHNNEHILTTSGSIKTVENYEHHNQQHVHDDSFVHHENLTDPSGTTHLIFRRSPNGRIYQNLPNFVMENDHNNSSHGTENNLNLLTTGHSIVTNVQEVFNQYDNESNNLNNSNIVTQNDERLNLLFNNNLTYNNTNNNNQQHNFTIVEPNHSGNILNNVRNHHNDNDIINVVMPSLSDKDQLLEMTMSPLLAAINNVTNCSDKQEEQENWTTNSLQNSNDEIQYYNMNDVTNRVPSTTTSTIINTVVNPNLVLNNQKNIQEDDVYKKNFKIINLRSSISEEYVDINDIKTIEIVNNNNTNNSSNGIYDEEDNDENYETNDDENITNIDESNCDTKIRKSRRKKKEPCLMVADKHVPCRAWASLPTNYLYIGKLLNNSAEYTVFSKKDIPLRTKFGPFEGDVREINEVDLDQLKKEKCKKYPLLIVGNNKILETSNENTSNWMRFVRFAETYSQQNILLSEMNDRLYFRSCKFIRAKQELRVGYSREYAKKYNLEILEPTKTDIENQNDWPCFECDKKFPSSSEMQKHLNDHDIEKPKKILNKKKKNLNKKKSAQRITCPVCCKSFFKNISFKRHIRIHNGHPLIEKCLNEPEKLKLQNNLLSPKKSVLINKNSSHHSPTTKLIKTKKLKNNKENSNNENLFKCDLCSKSFLNAERLKKHSLVHSCPNETKPYQCSHCTKRFLTLSAMAAHVKIHIYGRNYFQCLVCKERFKQNSEFSSHVKTHKVDGYYICYFCNKKFTEYVLMRKHVKAFHPAYMYSCTICDKKFPGLDKLRSHMLSHSDKKEFLCSICGKQFKRKDKLKEHIKRIHNPDNPKKTTSTPSVSQQTTTISSSLNDNGNLKIIFKETNTINEDCYSDSRNSNDEKSENYFELNDKNNEVKKNKTKFLPKVSPNDYQRFIYKCHDCLLGFKRRGMLVNHLAKRHPDIRIDSVPELNLPILKAQKFFYCQYCNKVYRSSAKRKCHILKYHPGAELPMSGRQKGGIPEVPGYLNPTYTEIVSTITTHAHACEWCHKQYASRTKLVEHQRKKHAENLEDINKINNSQEHLNNYNHHNYDNNSKLNNLTTLENYHNSNEIDYNLNSTRNLNESNTSQESNENYNLTQLNPINEKEIKSISKLMNSTSSSSDSQRRNQHDFSNSNSSSSATSDLSQFLDDFDYMNLKPVMQTQTTITTVNIPQNSDLLNLNQSFSDDDTGKKLIHNYTFPQNGG